MTFVVKMAKDVAVAVPPALSAITTYVLLEQERWFEKEIDFLQCFLKPGMAAVDIGANLGVYSLPIARLVGSEGRVYSYEPGGEARALLEKSRELNDLANLDIRALALSDTHREGYLAPAPSSELRALGNAEGSERIQVTSLDHESAAAGWPPIDFLKIDAEGEEERILAGGRDFFASHSPLVMFEIKAGDVVNHKLRTLFSQLGYRVFRQLVGAPILVPDDVDQPLDPYELNLFAAKPDRAAALAQQGLLAESIPNWRTNPPGMLGYESALDAFANWLDASLPVASRCGALAFALQAVRAACASNTSVARLSTWARVEWEWGARSESVTALTRLVQALGAEQPRPKESFLPALPHPAREGQSEASRIEWLSVSGAELYERGRSFSSYFTGGSPMLAWLCGQRLASAEMLRRQALIAARAGLAPQIPDRLCREANDHLNAAIWRDGLLPGTKPIQSRSDMSDLKQTAPELAADIVQDALTLHRRGAVAEAAARYRAALQVEPRNADALYYLAVIACQSGRWAEGVELARQSLTSEPQAARNFIIMARALNGLGQQEEALANLDRAIARDPQMAQAYGHRADILSDLGRYAEAVENYDRALALAPDAIEDRFNRGVALFAIGRYEDAVVSFDHVLAAKPQLVDAALWRARTLGELRRHDEAFDSLDKLVAVQPQAAKAWVARGNLLSDLDRDADAQAAYEKALDLAPELADAWMGLGGVLLKQSRHEQAFAALDRAFQLKPDLKNLAGQRIHAKQLLCDWTDLQAETAAIVAAVRDGKPVSAPFPLLALPSSPSDQLRCAQRYRSERTGFRPLWRDADYRHDRIRVGYLSADLREHAVAYLMAGLFEHHDSARFEVTALSTGRDPNSAMQARIKGAVEHFVDLDTASDEEIAQFVRRGEIDILVDLMGFTLHGRSGVLARRAAPVQVNYLGYSATMGAGLSDYIIADDTVIPEEQCAFYGEQVVWLPDSYLVTDSRRVTSGRTPSRAECGLPENGFVFCCFNNSYKLGPETFAVWMRLVAATPGSVMWLSEVNLTAQANLRREAQSRGVSADRLIFAARMPDPADHLARQRQADLFLDTLPYNAHTTACDALWAGVPVVTCLGATFAGRVAASLVRAAGLEELITHSLGEYEALALKLARDRALLASLREKLEHGRLRCPLFDTARTTRQIEAAYTMMWERSQRGEPARLPGEPRPLRVT